jgi:ArsR family transcriptional regulator, arsenate/arsenite/antimonite-responsive transcriptional repressor
LNTNNTATMKPRRVRTVPAASPMGKVSDDTIARLTQVFKLLADESRLKILLALAQDGEVHVSALCEMLDQSQPAVSHHLTLMRLTGLVSFRRQGKNNFYRLECGRLRDLLEQVFEDAGNESKVIRFPDFALAYKRAR